MGKPTPYLSCEIIREIANKVLRNLIWDGQELDTTDGQKTLHIVVLVPCSRQSGSGFSIFEIGVGKDGEWARGDSNDIAREKALDLWGERDEVNLTCCPRLPHHMLSEGGVKRHGIVVVCIGLQQTQIVHSSSLNQRISGEIADALDDKLCPCFERGDET